MLPSLIVKLRKFDLICAAVSSDAADVLEVHHTGASRPAARHVEAALAPGCPPFTPDGRHLVTVEGTDSGWVCLRDSSFGTLRHGRRVALPGIEGALASVALCPGRAVIVKHRGDWIRLFDFTCEAGRTSLLAPPDGNLMTNFSLSPDGVFLRAVVWRVAIEPAAVPPDAIGGLAAWHLPTGRVRFLDRFVSRPRLVTWSDDGRFVATAEDAAITIRETVTGLPRASIPFESQAPDAIALSPNGRSVAAAFQDTSVLVWDLWSSRGPATESTPSANDLDRDWADLLSESAAPAARAVRALSEQPGAAGLLAERLRAVHKPEPAGMRKLIENLDSRRFAGRRRAAGELARLGDAALPELERFLSGHPEYDAAQQAETLIDALSRPTLSGEPLRQWRAVEVLERIGTPEARNALHTIAAGAPEARLTREARLALARLGAP